ncbi:protein scribble homolog [Anneissia japonica]|uniref:protein scribble homolog n=1 Tax=Anneissia japonica TaxID=1529436 RepID=UPI00142554FF|nr:protein scribble homolog [Anneissia japonica]
MFRCIPLFRACNRHVEYIDKRHCSLTAVPDDIFRYGRTLEELLLDANQIRDLPKQFFRLLNLRKIGLSDNELERLPPEIGNFMNLLELDISRNDIFEIPDNIRFCKALVAVDLSGNPISCLPAGFTQLRNLKYLTLNDVGLESLPNDIGNLSNLVTLELRENLLKTLPPSLSLLVKLEQLDLGSNELEDLPETLGALPNLKDLWLDCNALTELPEELGNLTKLVCLDVSENCLETLPEEISGLKNLTDLHLSQNCLEKLPEGIGNLRLLSIIKVDQNRLTKLTAAIGSCVCITELILTENLLQELPASVGFLKKLHNLSVDRNRLTHLAPEVGRCKSLGVLSLRENRLTRLPPEIGNLKDLHVLNISGNRLEWLPIQLTNCNLKALWLSENQSQPMLKFQTDEIGAQKIKVLTCFLLPQTGPSESISLDNILKPNGTQDVMNDNRARVVNFPDFILGDEEDDELSQFQRQNTPHPRELKAKAKQLHDAKRAAQAAQTTNGDQEVPNEKEQHPENEVVEVKEPEPVEPPPPVETMSPPPPYSSVGAPISVNQVDFQEQVIQQTVSETQASQPEIEPHQEVEDEEDYNQEFHEKHVGFDVNLDSDEEQPERHEKLHRRDTPHYLKNKRVNDLDEDASAILNRVLAQQAMDTQQIREERTNRPAPILKLSNNVYQSINETFLKYEGTHTDQELSRQMGMVFQNPEKIVIEFTRDGGGLGISIAGGKGSTPYRGNDEGIFVSRVVPDGIAGKKGLRVGDKILAVNDHNLEAADHIAAVEALKSAGNYMRIVVIREEVLTYSADMQPVSEQIEQTTAENHESTPPAIPVSRPQERPGVSFAPEPVKQVVGEKIWVKLCKDRNGLGFSIAGGKGSTPYKGSDDSIFISRISQGGAADRSGSIRVGDKVIEINGCDVTRGKHEDAVKLLTTASEINMLVYRETTDIVHHQPIVMHNPPTFNLSFMEDFPGANDEVEEEQEPKMEEILLLRSGGPLGLSIVGGSDHSSHPFGANEPGVFISKIVPNGAAAKTNLCVGDRVIEVNGIDVQKASHGEAVTALLSDPTQIRLVVRHDKPPTGLQEIKILKTPGEKLGISIRGGNKGHPGNPLDKTDEGIFISKVNISGAARRDGRLKVGHRILEVNGQSLLGSSHTEAVRLLRGAGEVLTVLVCDGYDPEVVPPVSAVHGISDRSTHTSQESLSSIDREMTPEEIRKLNQECEFQDETERWEQEDLEKVRQHVEEEMTRMRQQETERLLAEELPFEVSRVESEDVDVNHKSEQMQSKPVGANGRITPEEEQTEFQQKRGVPPPIAPKPPKRGRDGRPENSSGSTSPLLTPEDSVVQLRSAKQARDEAIRVSRLSLTSTLSRHSSSYSLSTPPSSPQHEDLNTSNDRPGPEGLAFKDKWKHFETRIEEQNQSVPKVSGKRVDLVSGQDLNLLKEDEEQRMKGMTKDDIINYSLNVMDGDASITLDTAVVNATNTSSSSLPDLPLQIRTAKAERRYYDKLKSEGLSTDDSVNSEEGGLSPAELRSIQAEKRAAWRAARMKSLEDEALQAQIVIAKSRELEQIGKRVDNQVDELSILPPPKPHYSSLTYIHAVAKELEQTHDVTKASALTSDGVPANGSAPLASMEMDYDELNGS